MTRRSKVWLVVAVLFTLVNLASVPYHAALGELLWTAVHGGLALLGGYLVWRLGSRRSTGRGWGGAQIPAHPGEIADRLTHLEQSVDAVAVEVERIGEGQRFMTRVLTKNDTQQSPGEGAAEPIEIKAGETAPHVRRS